MDEEEEEEDGRQGQAQVHFRGKHASLQVTIRNTVVLSPCRDPKQESQDPMASTRSARHLGGRDSLWAKNILGARGKISAL